MATFLERIAQHQFSALVGIANNDLFDLEKQKIIKRFNSSHNPFYSNPVVIIADPFLFVKENELYIFYEEQTGLEGKGVIKMSKTKDLKNWTSPIIVLEENFHLSFPFVFKHSGQIYMIPETGDNKTISIYKPNENLTKWSFHKTILSGKHFADSFIINNNNVFYLFTTDFSNRENILELYYSNSLDGNWTEHPQSPILIGKNRGRGAGAIFRYNRKIYRPCQRTEKRYGEGVDLYEVTVLNQDEYKEVFVKTLIPNKKYPLGGHHFNYFFFNNQAIVATDIFELKVNLKELIRRTRMKFIGS